MLGTPDYWRVRLGIGHPGHKDRVLGHVLGDFAKVDGPWLAACWTRWRTPPPCWRPGSRSSS